MSDNDNRAINGLPNFATNVPTTAAPAAANNTTRGSALKFSK
jgi:hypothetical protein